MDIMRRDYPTWLRIIAVRPLWFETMVLCQLCFGVLAKVRREEEENGGRKTLNTSEIIY